MLSKSISLFIFIYKVKSIDIVNDNVVFMLTWDTVIFY